MRRAIVYVLTAALVASLVAAPAAANRHRRVHVHESFAAEALPFPNLSGVTGTERRGCFAGIEDVHWVGENFRSPGRGRLDVYMEGFLGDWDLAVFDRRGRVLAESLQDQTAGAEAEERLRVRLRRNQRIVMVACNWLGEPGPVEVHYEGVFRR
jgi:hypothetical protein